MLKSGIAIESENAICIFPETLNDKSVILNDKSMNLNDKSVNLNEKISNINEKSNDLTQKTMNLSQNSINLSKNTSNLTEKSEKSINSEPLIIRKADGGYLYGTTDLAALKHRTAIENATRIIYVTDAGQAEHFKMVFMAAKKSKLIENEIELVHVPFGVVQVCYTIQSFDLIHIFNSFVHFSFIYSFIYSIIQLLNKQIHSRFFLHLYFYVLNDFM